MESGKPQKQSLAIAYSVQRRNKGKKMAKGGPITVTQEPDKAPARKKGAEGPSPDEFMAKRFAEGGMAKDDDHIASEEHDIHEMADKRLQDTQDGIRKRMEERQSQGKPGYAHGGTITVNEEPDMAPHKKPGAMGPDADEYMASHFAEGGMPMSPAERIMHRKKMMAEGGMADLDEASEEGGQSPYDTYNHKAAGKQYDDSQISAQPKDSGEHGDELTDEDKDSKSLTERIRERMRTRRGF